MTDRRSVKMSQLCKKVNMAPRKVNKEEKRREVALACSDLVHQGIRKITVAEVA